MPFDSDDAATAKPWPGSTAFSRRAVVAGAAWSVPAIVLATTVPAYASSGSPKLAFDQGSYNGTACGTITGASVTATDGGTPTAGVSVTVSLSDYYVFTASGATSATGTTDGSGRFDVPSISVPNRGGTGTATATASSYPSTSASLVAAEVDEFGFVEADSLTWKAASRNVPPGSHPTVGTFTLAPNGDLYMGQYGTPVQGGVDRMSRPNGGWLGWVYNDGTFAYTRSNNEMYPTASGVPAGSEPLIGDWFLASDGRVYDHTAAIVATDIDSVGYERGGFFGVVRRSGELGYYDGNLQYHVANAAVPSGAKPTCGVLFLTSGGDLIAADTGATFATGVSKVGAPMELWFSLALTSGAFAYVDDNGQYSAASPAIPANSAPVGKGWFLTPDYRLLDASGSVIFTDIAEVGIPRETGLAFRKKMAC
ncbi:hypothetical protein [Microbacterium sp. BH-3-3-3]|uniref:hypothetical protein n=1 Tax=Microbacterium sp. BH-3-3-3 TaxID=1906742 RepID=UPI0011A8D4C2|nr:hypothetical protein [Microbacterium sp. BH-3-3-3]